MLLIVWCLMNNAVCTCLIFMGWGCKDCQEGAPVQDFARPTISSHKRPRRNKTEREPVPCCDTAG